MQYNLKVGDVVKIVSRGSLTRETHMEVGDKCTVIEVDLNDDGLPYCVTSSSLSEYWVSSDEIEKILQIYLGGE